MGHAQARPNYSKLHLKSIKIYLSKLYISMYYEVQVCYNSINERAHMQTAVLCDEATSLSTPSSFLKEKEILKDKKDTVMMMMQWMNLHQNNSFINWMRLPLLCEKSGAILLVLVGLTAVWQAVRRNTGEFENF